MYMGVIIPSLFMETSPEPKVKIEYGVERQRQLEKKVEKKPKKKSKSK
jgi:hypothetical protein